MHTWYHVARYAFYVNPKISCFVFVLRLIHLLLLWHMASCPFFVTSTNQKTKMLYSCLMVAKWCGHILIIIMGKVFMVGLGPSWSKKYEKNRWKWIVNNSKMLQMLLHFMKKKDWTTYNLSKCTKGCGLLLSHNEAWRHGPQNKLGLEKNKCVLLYAFCNTCFPSQ